jgi:hypothetical protein
MGKTTSSFYEKAANNPAMSRHTPVFYAAAADAEHIPHPQFKRRA